MKLFSCFTVDLFLLLILNIAYGIRISEKECVEYRKAFNDTDDEDLNEIVFPDPDWMNFPFMARIVTNSQHHNGILISEYFVVSTAHLFELYSEYIVTVMLGDFKLGTNNEHSVRQRTYEVIEMFVHPNFNGKDLTSNIKLFKLNASVTFDKYIRPACLYLDQPIPKQLTEIGWSSRRIHTAELNYISNESCKENRPNYQIKYITEIDNGTIFCAEPKEGDQIMCDGFVGSAVINELNEIVGIASVSHCNDYRTPRLYVFVRVSAYIDWIEDIVWSTSSSTQSRNQNGLNCIFAIILTILKECGLF